jgi:hypothetical protein
MSLAGARNVARRESVKIIFVPENAKCIRLFVPIAVKKSWFLSNRTVINRFIVVSVFWQCEAGKLDVTLRAKMKNKKTSSTFLTIQVFSLYSDHLSNKLIANWFPDNHTDKTLSFPQF